MKKTIIYLMLSFLAVAVILSVATTIIIQNAQQNNETFDIEPSDDYEVIDFVPPRKNIYYLSEVQTAKIIGLDEEDSYHFRQLISFNGEGMSMTVRHKKTGEEKTYDYNGYSFEIDGEQKQYNEGNLNSPSSLNIQYTAELDTILTPGQREAQVVLTTDTGDFVVQDWTFSLMADPKSSLSTYSETEEDVQVEIETTPEGLVVLPDIARAWYHATEPGVNYVSITNQDNNSFTLHISSIKGEDSPMARAEVPITLENVHRDGSIVTGESDFEYTDTYGNKGQGTINVHENAIILVINEMYSSGKGWGISEATGVYY